MSRAVPIPPREFRRPSWLQVALLFGAALLVYWPALRGGFVWNDSDYVTQVSLRSWHGLGLIWFKLGATQQYYPLLHTAFWFEHRLWGDAALGYHLINVLLHAGSATLLWFCLRQLRVPGAWLAALIFIVHPVGAESVAWISEQKNTLSTLFYLAAAWNYLRFDEQRRGTSYGLGLAFFILALLSKTVAATLPAALLVVFWWRRGRLDGRRDLVPLIPWFALGAASGLFSAWVERTYIGASGSDFALNAVERVLVSGRMIWFYLGKLLWPAGINFIYPRWQVSAAAPGQYLYPVAALALTLGLWFWSRRARGPLAAWLFFVGSLFPTLGFFNVFAFIFSYVADHWQYLASIGIFALLASATTAAVARAPMLARRAILLLVGAAIGIWGNLTWNECGIFRDAATFYRAILARNPAAWMAQNNLGIELEHQGQLGSAIAHYESAVQLRPGYAEAHTNLGLALCATGRVEEGIDHYRIALQSEPNNAVVHNDLGVAFAGLGRLPEAIEQYEAAARLNPAYLDPVLNLGFVYFRGRRLPEAIASYERALHLEPGNANAENCLGLVLAASGRMAEALTHYEKAVRAKPNYADARCNLGAAYGAAGRFDEAQQQFEAALEANDRLPDAHYNLGLVLSMKHRWPEAIAQFEAAVRLQPNFADAERDWGRALESLSRPAEAKLHLDNAVRLQGASGHPVGP